MLGIRVVLNATSCASDAQIDVLISEGCVFVLGLFLNEMTMVTMAFKGLECVLQVVGSRAKLVSKHIQ